MADRIVRPSAREDRPKTSDEETAEFMAQKRARNNGADFKCETCFHCYPVRLQALDAKPELVCYEGPPRHALMADNRGGVMAKHVPTIVGAEFFCHRWRTRD